MSRVTSSSREKDSAAALDTAVSRPSEQSGRRDICSADMDRNLFSKRESKDWREGIRPERKAVSTAFDETSGRQARAEAQFPRQRESRIEEAEGEDGKGTAA